MNCPACDGKRWVDSKHKGPTICPLCNGTGEASDKNDTSKSNKYDQDAIWTEMVNGTPTDLDSAMKILNSLAVTICPGPYSFIIHLLFDKNVTPSGSLIFDQVILGTLRTGQQRRKLTPEHLAAKGYSVLPNGNVQSVHDVPVGPIYNILVEWGKSDEPDSIVIDVNRKGNPFFMDNNMIAIGATYKQRDKIRESLEALINVTKPVGQVINLGLVFSSTGF